MSALVEFGHVAGPDRAREGFKRHAVEVQQNPARCNEPCHSKICFSANASTFIKVKNPAWERARLGFGFWFPWFVSRIPGPVFRVAVPGSQGPGSGIRDPGSGIRVSGSQFRILNVGFRVPGFRFWVPRFGFLVRGPGLGFRFPVLGIRFRVSSFGIRDPGSTIRAPSFGFRVSGLEFRVPGLDARVDNAAREAPGPRLVCQDHLLFRIIF